MNSWIPLVPVTPSLDHLLATYPPPGGGGRYELVPNAVGWVDKAMTLYDRGVDWANQPIDRSMVDPVDVTAARAWQTALSARIAECGSTLPMGDPNHPEQIPVEQPAPPVTVAPVAPAVPASPLAPEPPAPPAPPAPPTVVAPEPEHAENWLQRFGHVVTPENIETVLTMFSALSQILHARKRP